eukprot:jgi/Chrzof1/13967/Cz08g19210.t1
MASTVAFTSARPLALAAVPRTRPSSAVRVHVGAQPRVVLVRAQRQGATKQKQDTRGKKTTLTVPRNEDENRASVVGFVAFAALFLTGVIFVFPAIFPTQKVAEGQQSAFNKTFNVQSAGEAQRQNSVEANRINADAGQVQTPSL